MADYTQFLTRAVAALDPNTPEQRQALDDRARKALIDKLRAGDPALSEHRPGGGKRADREASIRRVEADVVRRVPHPQPNPADEPDDAPVEEHHDRPPLKDSRKPLRIAAFACGP